MIITLLHSFSGAVGVDQQNVWANEFDLGHPVVNDEDFVLSGVYWSDSARPRALYIGPGAEIIDRSVSPSEFVEGYL